MATLNLKGAEVIQKYQLKACTDVTGFGIKGHANYLAQVQKDKVDFVIKNFPIAKNLIKISNTDARNFK